MHIQCYQNLSHKLWCYTRISSPEKSCNNTHEKIWFFLRVWYRQSAADTSIVFCTTWSGWWMNGKAFIILNPWSFVRIFSDYGCQNSEKLILCKDIDLQTLLEGEENQTTKRKTESYVFLGFGNGISRSWERKSTTKRFATGRFWPCTWKISCILKTRPIVCFCSDSTHVFILSAPTHFTISIRGLPVLLISFINKVDFSN